MSPTFVFSVNSELQSLVAVLGLSASELGCLSKETGLDVESTGAILWASSKICGVWSPIAVISSRELGRTICRGACPFFSFSTVPDPITLPSSSVLFRCRLMSSIMKALCLEMSFLDHSSATSSRSSCEKV